MSSADTRVTPLRTAITAGSISIMAAIGDVLIIVLTGFLIYAIYVGWDYGSLPQYTAALAIKAAFTYFIFQRAGLYRFEEIAELSPQYFQIAFWSFFVFLVMALAGTGLKITESFSRVWFFASLVSSTALICGFRVFLGWKIKQWGRSAKFVQRIAIYGATPQAAALIRQITQREAPWLRLIGVFDDRHTKLEQDGLDMALYAGTMDELARCARSNQIDHVLIALPWSDDQHVFELAQKLRELPVHVALVTDMVGFRLKNPKLHTLLGVPMLGIAVRPMEGWRIVLKELQDRALGTIFLVLAAPILLGVAIAIQLDSPGPILFRQTRHGFNNQEIDIFKFRSMYHKDAPETEVPQATKDDPRVTKVGRFIRRTSLDELPQLFNVLNGTMSLVGPRPHAIQHNELYASLIKGYNIRHNVKPGITGWAQVCGYRGETNTVEEMEARVSSDIYYIENWSIFFDLKILVMTISTLFHHKAY